MRSNATMHPAALRIERARAFERYTTAIASNAAEPTPANAALLDHARRELDGIDALIGTAVDGTAGADGRNGVERRSGMRFSTSRPTRGEGV